MRVRHILYLRVVRKKGYHIADFQLTYIGLFYEDIVINVYRRLHTSRYDLHNAVTAYARDLAAKVTDHYIHYRCEHYCDQCKQGDLYGKLEPTFYHLLH